MWLKFFQEYWLRVYLQLSGRPLGVQGPCFGVPTLEAKGSQVGGLAWGVSGAHHPEGGLHLGSSATTCSTRASFCEKPWMDQPGWLAGAVPRVPRCTGAWKMGHSWGLLPPPRLGFAGEAWLCLPLNCRASCRVGGQRGTDPPCAVAPGPPLPAVCCHWGPSGASMATERRTVLPKNVSISCVWSWAGCVERVAVTGEGQEEERKCLQGSPSPRPHSIFLKSRDFIVLDAGRKSWLIKKWCLEGELINWTEVLSNSCILDGSGWVCFSGGNPQRKEVLPAGQRRQWKVVCAGRVPRSPCRTPVSGLNLPHSPFASTRQGNVASKRNIFLWAPLDFFQHPNMKI